MSLSDGKQNTPEARSARKIEITENDAELLRDTLAELTGRDHWMKDKRVFAITRIVEAWDAAND